MASSTEGIRRVCIVRVFVVLVLALAMAGHSIDSRADSFTEDSGTWITTSASYDLGPLWRAGLTVQTRTQGDFSDLERTVLRPSVSYNVTGRMWLTAGYDAHFIELPTDRLEQRAWQQVQTAWPLSFATVSGRIRLEERFIENVDGTAVRLRLQARTDVPVQGTQWKMTASNEYFVGLNDVEFGPRDGFDQNRAYVGVSRTLTDSLSLDLGYQNQYVNRRGGQDVMTHQFMVGVSFK